MNDFAARMTPNITTMIRLDHSHVTALAHRYKADTSVARKRALVRNACLALEVHAQLEEEIFYPALRKVVTGDPVLDKSEPEHNEMRRLIGELREVVKRNDSAENELDDRFHELIRLVMHHVADEETRLLPVAERLLRDQLGQLGVQMARRRMQLVKPHAREMAETTLRSFPVGAAAAALLVTSAVAMGALLATRRSGDHRSTRR